MFTQNDTSIELIPIRDHAGQRAVSGRDLHDFLELGRDYTNWFKRMTSYGFLEGQDFTPVWAESTGGRPSVDHALTLDMAKELAMLQRTERGKQARLYFIEVEKRARAGAGSVPDISTPQGVLALAQQLTRTAEQLVEANEQIALDAPKVAQAEAFRQADGLRTISDLANDLQVHASSNFPGLKVLHKDVFDLAGRLEIIIRGNTVRHNQPTSKAIQAGWVRPKDHTHETNNHGLQTKVYARLTPRGWGRLWDAAVRNLSVYGAVLPAEVPTLRAVNS